MTAFARILDRVYRDRQIFVRTDGRVRFVRVSAGMQKFLSGVALGTLLWAGLATWSASDRQAALEASQQRVADLERERSRLGGELAAVQAHYANAAVEVDRQLGELRQLVLLRDNLQGNLARARAEIAGLRDDYRTTRDERDDLGDEVAALRGELRERIAANGLMEQRLSETASALAGASIGRRAEMERSRLQQDRLSALESALSQSSADHDQVRQRLYEQQQTIEEVRGDRDVARAEIRQMSSRVASLNSDLDVSRQTNANLRQRLAATADALTRTHEGQIQAERRGYKLASTVSALESRLDQVRETQLELLRGIRLKAQHNIAALKATLEMTAIPLDDLLQATDSYRPGIGGPLVPMDGGDIEDASFENMVGGLEMELLRWEAMQEVLAKAPLARPVTTGYVSSGFGRRKDPITGRQAFHEGLDIAAPPRTPIYATAPGLVTFAGRKTAYGRFVEIDHGNGFVTRYGHLRSIGVEAGQSVAFHDEIGRMGSSGRSTGSHVHYEVLFQGEQVDPSNFLKAGRYVFKVKDAGG